MPQRLIPVEVFGDSIVPSDGCRFRTGDEMDTKDVEAGSAKKPKGLFTLLKLRDLALLLLFLVFAYRLAIMPELGSLNEYRFTDLLSMALAIFAIALSVAFYMKADESSKTFYDNTHKFTNRMSEMLGRIEAGFGEKLSQLQVGYNGINLKIDNLPKMILSPEDDREGRLSYQKIQSEIDSMRETIGALSDAGMVKDEEIEKLRGQLDKVDKNIKATQRRAESLSVIEVESGVYVPIPPQEILKPILDVMGTYFFPIDRPGNEEVIRKKFMYIYGDPNLPEECIEFLKEQDLITPRGGLTDKGVHFFRLLVSNFI